MTRMTAADWPKNGAYAGTRGECLRIEAVKIVLTDRKGNAVPGYSVQYRGHVQNIGDLPKDASQWLADGEQLGTVGSSLRLEALLVQVVKTAVDPPQPVEPTVYDKAGSYGPSSGSETIAGDVTVAADGVTLNNLVISGNLTIGEAVGDGSVTLNNVTVAGDTVVRGGGKNSIHINGGQYSRIVMEKTASGAVRIVATGVDGMDVVVAEDAVGETIILEGAFASVVVNAPNMIVTTQGNTTTIGTLTVGAAAPGAALNLAAGTTVGDLILDGKAAAVKGQGTVTRAEVNADSAVFEKAPGAYAVESTVVIPPVFPNPGGGGGGGGTPSKTNLTIEFPTLTVFKVYDGSTSAAVTPGNLRGVAAGDAGNVTVTAMANYDTKNVGSGKTVRVVYTLAGSAAAKYNKPADLVVNTGTIVAKALTIADPTLTTVKEYDGTAAAAVTAGELSGKESGDTVTVTPTARYNDASRADNKTITVVYSLGGADAGNYTAPADYAVSNGQIVKKQLTINGLPVMTEKVYDGNQTCTDKAWDFAGRVADEDVGVTCQAAYDEAKAGDRTITLTYSLIGTDQDNYLAPASGTVSGKITPKPLTVTTVVVEPTKVYDGNSSTAATVSSFAGKVGTEAIGLAATASYNDKTVGTGKPITVNYSLTGDDAVMANYSAPDSQVWPDTGTITARPLQITTVPTVTTTKPYDGSITAVVTGNAASDAIAGDQLIITPTASYDDASVNANKVITISYDLSGDDAGNYSKPGDNTVAGAISKRMLSYTVSPAYPTRVYDQTSTAPITVSDIGNIVGSEDVGIAMTANYNTKDVGSGKPVTIVMNLTGANSGNYQVTVPHLTGEITARPLEASGVTVTTTKDYDGQTAAAISASGTVTGALSGETVSATPAANYDTKNVGEDKLITVSYSLSGEADVTKNYSAPASYEYGTKGTINTIPLSITGIVVNHSKVYDGTTDVVVTNHGSLVDNCVGDDLTPVVTAWYENPDIGNSKNIYASFIVTGADRNNYTTPYSYQLSDCAVIQKDIKVSSYSSGTSSWSTAVQLAGVSMTSLPSGYTIFDCDNDGNIYAGNSDGTIKKYSGGSWSDTPVFSGSLPVSPFKFAGIYKVGSDSWAIGVGSDNKVYTNINDGSGWTYYDSLSVSSDFQLVGGYYDADSFYLVYQKGSAFYKHDITDASTTTPPFLAGGVDIPGGYTICGFNNTGQLNMYLTK